MERILILGAKGMVGSALMDILSSRFEWVGLGHEDLDVTAERDTIRAVMEVRPRTVIHAAAFTDVDGCEKDRDRAFRVNSDGTLHVARACRQAGAGLVYLSTDYVFDGKASRPYKEDNPVHPLNVYGKSKLEGERHVQRIVERHLVVRTQWVYGRSGKNFVTTVLRLAKTGKPLTIVHDQTGSPTYAADLSLAIVRLLENGSKGVVHVANSSWCSWYDFAQEIIDAAAIPGIEIIPVDTASSGRPALRPTYSVLDCQKLTEETGLKMRPWQKAVRELLKKEGIP